MTTYDAMLFKNKCKKCFDCPSCFSILSFAQKIEGENRIVYLHCNLCRWNSLSIDLKADTPNALITTFIKQECVLPQQLKITTLVDEYKQEASELRKRMRASSSRFATIKRDTNLEKPLIQIGLSEAITWETADIKRRETDEKLGWNGICLPKTSVPSQPESVEQIKDHIRNLVNLTAECVPSLEQRLCDLNIQNVSLQKANPTRKRLLTRRSKRCSQCDKLLIKPDLIPSKSDFKREHTAVKLVPRIFVKNPVLQADNQTLLVLLTIVNPLALPITLQTLELTNFFGNTVKKYFKVDINGKDDEYDSTTEQIETANDTLISSCMRVGNTLQIIFNIASNTAENPAEQGGHLLASFGQHEDEKCVALRLRITPEITVSV
eukprot:TRINITY_DN5150_c0_g1_i1.p1 TRINITY_DN5150_c0_g1~~TRINITY_DN5150_c0_g1_i1.p1  ORF type:complete len:435 (+),score=40.57 TRINITY_DN5150_c0_g1_i1:170-1306(+)